VTGEWWPTGAPYPRIPFGQYTSHELAVLIEWTASGSGQRVAELHDALAVERIERRQCLRAVGKPTPGSPFAIPAPTA
jgi:hypothetical protein